MKNHLALALLLVALPAGAAPARRMIVGTKHPAAEALQRLRSDDFHPADRLGLRLKTFQYVNAFVADLDERQIATLKKSPEVEYVEADVERHALGLETRPNEELFTQITPYGINMVRAPQAWAAGRGAGINVVVVDTGIDYHHPELVPVYAGGYNAIDDTNDPLDDHGHGTHVSGTIAAADDATGVVGVAPKVRLWVVKVLKKNDSGGATGAVSDTIKAYEWVITKKKELGGNWIVSLSLGSCEPSLAERNTVNKLTAAGVLVVAAAGNHPDSNCQDANFASVDYPAAYDGVVAVAAVDSASTVGAFSNTGPQVALAAPGVNVLSTYPLGSGTLSLVTPTGSPSILAPPLKGSAAKDASGPYVYCGLGNPADFPSSVAGKIALIKRGTLTFHDKVKNAQAAGATAVVIFNNDASPLSWTLYGLVDPDGQQNSTLCSNPATVRQCHDDPADVAYGWPLTLAIPLSEGQALIDQPKPSLSAHYRDKDDYAILSGTSMAAPHVTGVAAAVWSMAPNATAAQVKQALLATAHDLGEAGPDFVYGYGLVDAEAAGRQLNPTAFPPPVPNGRPPGRRHP